jgi:hypothetical protein
MATATAVAAEVLQALADAGKRRDGDALSATVPPASRRQQAAVH